VHPRKEESNGPFALSRHPLNFWPVAALRAQPSDDNSAARFPQREQIIWTMRRFRRELQVTVTLTPPVAA
jgi:hypothetical protein